MIIERKCEIMKKNVVLQKKTAHREKRKITSGSQS